MNAQLHLPGITVRAVNYDHCETIGERFHAFHGANPQVLDALVSLCLDVKRRGRKRWSTKGAFEVLRWSSLRTTGDDFKLNNNFTSLYARLIPMVEPELAGFFATRGDTLHDDFVAAIARGPQ